MARLIDADALYAYVREEQRRNPHNGHVERIMHNHEHEAFLRDIWYAPTIDAVPVVHGRWVQVICHVEFEDGFVDRLYECCSGCHTPNGRNTSNYCPNCGARMDGDS